MQSAPPGHARQLIERAGLQALLDALRAEGYQVVGPTLRDAAIVYDAIEHVEDLPEGWTDRQDAGRYRLERRSDAALFGYAVGPHAWKRFLHPPVQRLWRARPDGTAFVVEPEPEEAPRYAFLGVRSCELHAIAIQDRVLVGERYADEGYRAHREGAFLVALNCAEAGGTCFCVSMGTGPRVTSGFDLALTELVDAGRHAFVVQVGSERGAAVLAKAPHRAATGAECEAAEAVVARTAGRMGREMPAEGLRELLLRNPEHPRWDEVAGRCLACTNCTLVCPTCFCTSVEDSNDLADGSAAHTRRWDSCFTTGFTELHGGTVRASGRARYRQWLTHKLATWFDQFGTSGCVGCGRCITWCPVGIDITEEAHAIRAADGARKGGGHGAA
jgi:sulfhydrogenase subunit beta (sulfur reductase)